MRDRHGKAVAPDKDEKVTGQKAVEGETSEGKRMDPAEHLKNCDDCMKNVIAHAGVAHKSNGMKSEDQGGKAGNPARGHDTERKGADYRRQRH